ncbi:MAG: TRAP transporter small permease subunit [Rhodospirillales bacterium]|nr:MAG: TRAP transporter small permease subunit [Rhodospirillales bacterium]
MQSDRTGQRGVAAALTWLVRVELFVTCMALLLVASALFIDVVAREAFGQGIFGAQKLAVYCNAIAGLLGFAVVVHAGGHLRVSAVDNLFPTTWHPAMSRLGDVVSAALCAMLGWFAVKYVQSSMRLGEVDLLFYAELWPVQLVLPYIFYASSLRYLCFAAYPALRPREAEPQ